MIDPIKNIGDAHKVPRVFISSSIEDLKSFREAARQAVLEAGLLPVMHEYWVGTNNPPLEECLTRVDQCDLIIALVARRHGWTPPDQEPDRGKSITRLECERGIKRGLSVLPFVLRDTTDWSSEYFETYRLKAAADRGDFDGLPALAKEVQRNQAALVEFKEWLLTTRICGYFSTPEELRAEIVKALLRWSSASGDSLQAHFVSRFDRVAYCEWLRRHCETVSLLGMNTRVAYKVRLQEVYVPSMVAWEDPELGLLEAQGIQVPERKQLGPSESLRIELPLLHRLSCQSLCVVGAPGVGKSTFCRWLALVLAAGEVPTQKGGVPIRYQEQLFEGLSGRLPVLCNLRDLTRFLRGGKLWTRKDLEEAFGRWLDIAKPGNLDGSTWKTQIEKGACVMIFDGLDEIPARLKEGKIFESPRSSFLTGLADALPYWQERGNKILLTSRPYYILEASRQIPKLATAAMLPLDEILQRMFIQHWFSLVDLSNAPVESARLMESLLTRGDLEWLREIPMYLTALCIKYLEGNRLPRDINVLYDTQIDTILFRGYPDTADQVRARRRLAAVALGMHEGVAVEPSREAPKAVVGYSELDQILADYIGQEKESEISGSTASQIRENLVSQSGLLLPQGVERAGFGHLSIQEYLAAERLEMLRADLEVYLQKYGAVPEWRHTLLFLFSMIAEQAPEVALNAIGKVLLPQLIIDNIKENANPAVLLLDCLEIANARHWKIEAFKRQLWIICEQSLTQLPQEELRSLFWISAGKFSIDRRAGVGLDTEGLPDIVWCPVPAGKVTIDDASQQLEVDQFSVSKYLVTSAQFQAFVEAEDGYGNVRWWEGFRRISRDGPVAARWPIANNPREMVSWLEAVAFCRWLSAKVGLPIRLPTELEWQLAAKACALGSSYPWGPTWNPARLNAEGSLGRTTSVGIYPDGASACGSLDMAGNVWEWCLNRYDNPNNLSIGDGVAMRAVRGGSWADSKEYCRIGARLGVNSNDRSGSVGFRLCMTPVVGNDRV